MNGKEIFEKYQAAAEKAGPGTDAWSYFRILHLGLLIVGDSLFKSLEDAEKAGKKIGLTHPIPFNVGPSEPDGIEII